MQEQKRGKATLARTRLFEQDFSAANSAKLCSHHPHSCDNVHNSTCLRMTRPNVGQWKLLLLPLLQFVAHLGVMVNRVLGSCCRGMLSCLTTLSAEYNWGISRKHEQKTSPRLQRLKRLQRPLQYMGPWWGKRVMSGRADCLSRRMVWPEPVVHRVYTRQTHIPTFSWQGCGRRS